MTMMMMTEGVFRVEWGVGVLWTGGGVKMGRGASAATV